MKHLGLAVAVAAVGLCAGLGPVAAGNTAAGTAKLNGVNTMKPLPQHVTPVARNLGCTVTPPISLPPTPITGTVVTVPSKVVITNNLSGIIVPAGLPITYVVSGHSYVNADSVALKPGDKFLIDFNAESVLPCTATATF